MGNARLLLNAAGQVIGDCAYTAWGTKLSPAYLDSPFGFKGQWGAYRDAETGLVLMGARTYSPAIGRFLSRDPSGYAAGPNLYGFCGGDPVNFFDRTGFDDELEDGPEWAWVRDGAEYIDAANTLPRMLGLPCVNPLGTLIAAHDSFRDWGEAEGNTKTSAGKLLWMRAGAFTHFGLAVMEFSGYANMGLGALGEAVGP